jgi:outer membrane protein TolC
LLAFAGGSLFAQDVALRLDEAIGAALSRHPSLRMAEARRDAARGKADEVRSGLFPQLRLTGRVAYQSDVPEFVVPFIAQPLFPSITNTYATRLTLQQNLFTGFRIRGSLSMAEAGAHASEHELRRDRSDLVLTVTSAYWNLYRAERLRDVLGQSFGQISAHLRDVTALREKGLATEADVLKVETQLSDVRVRLIQARGAMKLSQMTLNSLTGDPLERPVRAVEDPMSDSGSLSPADIDSVVSVARSQRPEIAALKERKVMQEAALTAAQGGWYPAVSLVANLDYARPHPRVIPPKDQWESTWDVGVQIQWNIWDWFATASQTEQARAQMTQAEAALQQTNDAVALEAAQAAFAVEEARERTLASGLGERQAMESFRIAREKFALGMLSSTDLLDAETALLHARLTDAQARTEYAIQRERFRRAVGERP